MKDTAKCFIKENSVACFEQDSIVLLEQLRTIDKWRLGDYIGKINKALMEEVNHGLAVSIGLNHLISEPLTLSLCSVCADQFYSSPSHTIRRADLDQFEKDTCMYCNVRKGYDFIIRKKSNGHKK